MALELKKRSKLFLKSQKVDVGESTSSPESFGITELPPYFGEGKNSFKIKPGTGFLKSGTEIQFEILDSNGNPIYWETSTYKDSDNSRLVSVWVYDLPTNKKYDTPDGRAELIVVGTLKSGGVIRWTKKIDVVKSKQSPSNIIFLTTPKSIISSSVETFTNKLIENNQLVKTITNSDVYYKKSTFGNTTSLEYANGDAFEGQMVGGIVYGDLSTTLYPRLGGGQSQPTSFTASITGISGVEILRLANPFTASDSRSDGSIHTYEYTDGTINVNVEYYSTGSDTSTQNQIAFANVSLTNVNPIGGRVYSVRTSIKSDGLSNSDYSVIGETKIENTSSISYKVPVPTEHLNDPKTLRIQFVNQIGNVSNTEIVTSGLVFTGGNAYIAGDQSLITGSFHIGNTIGTGIEMAGHSSGYLKSVGYKGMTSASLGLGPGGFMIWSGSNNLQVGADQYPGVGMEMVSAGGSSSFYFTTHDGGNLKVVTDEFFIGTKNTQFVSGSNGNIEISSSFFHLDPKNQKNIIGGFIVTPTAISASTFISASTPALALKANGQISASQMLVRVKSGTQLYTLFDTKNGIIDARNNGRQLISDYTEYELTATSSFGSYTKVANYYFQLMPGENRILYNFSHLAHRQASGLTGGYIRGWVKMTFQVPNTGSVTNGPYGYTNTSDGTYYYDGFANATEYDVFESYLGSISTNDYYSSKTNQPGDSFYTIPAALEGRAIRANLYLKLSEPSATTGTKTSGTFTRVKGVSVVSTREFGQVTGDISQEIDINDGGGGGIS